MRKNQVYKKVIPGLLAAVLLVQSAFMPVNTLAGAWKGDALSSLEHSGVTEESTDTDRTADTDGAVDADVDDTVEERMIGVVDVDTKEFVNVTSVISPSEKGYVGAWNPIRGQNVSIYAKGNTYTQPEFMDFTYEDNRPGGVIYCIQPGASISNGDVLSAVTFDGTYPLLSETQKRDVRRVTGYMTYDVEYHTGETEANKRSLNYYWTYQCLLWYYCGAMTDEDAYKTMSTNGVGDYTEYTRIRGLMDEYEVIPSYCSSLEAISNPDKSYELTSNGDGTFSTISYDTTGMLKSGRMQQISCSQTNLSFTQCLADGTPASDGEYMKITSTDYIEKSSPVICKQMKKVNCAPYCYNNILLYNGTTDHQNCLSIGTSDSTTIGGTFSVYTQGYGRIVIHKTCDKTQGIGDAPTLANAVYAVYTTEDVVWNGTAYKAGGKMTSITIGKDGYGTLDKIPYSTYLVKEEKAPDGYYVDATVYRATCNSANANEAGVAEITVESLEEPILFKYEIVKKTYEKGVIDGELYAFPNCEFGIYRLNEKTPLCTIVTDADGYAAFDKLYAGTYVIQELVAGDDQHRRIAPYTVTLGAEASDLREEPVITKVLIDDWISARIAFVKYDTFTGTSIPLGHATYKIQDALTGEYLSLRSYSVETGELITTDTFTSDDAGEFYFEDAFPIGTYIWEEQATDDISRYGLSDLEVVVDNQGVHYRKRNSDGTAVTDEYTDADVQIGTDGVEVYVLPAEDTPHSVTVEKLDSDGNRLAGATLGIVIADGDKPAVNAEGNYQFLELPVVENQTLSYDSDGTVHMAPAVWTSEDALHTCWYLPIGEYYLVEVTPPDGYVSAEPIRFSIRDEEAWMVVEGESVFYDYTAPTVTMVDRKIDMVVSKQDITTGAELPGAELQVTDSEGNLIDQWISTDTPHELPGSLLKVGERYTLTEIMAPENYLCATSIEFTVLDVLERQKVILYNTPMQGTIQIYKTGEQVVTARECESANGAYVQMVLEQLPLADAEFEVYDSKDMLVDKVTTDEDGLARTKTLPWGEYYLIETKAPDGMVLTQDKIPVTLEGTESETTLVRQDVELSNDLSEAVLNIYKVGETKTTEDGITVVEMHSLQDVVFGLYAKEDVLGVDGTVVVHTDDCLGYSVTNEDGIASFQMKLPEGFYYYKELSAPEEYEVSETSYDFVLELGTQVLTTIELNKNNPVVNYLKRPELVSPAVHPFPVTGDVFDGLFVFVMLTLAGVLGVILCRIHNLK